MIQTQGFASSVSVSGLADEINRWLVNNTKNMDAKFRLININYSSTSETNKDHSHVNYSALVLYEMVETKKTDPSEPLESSVV